jgi:hypothetical protein
VQVVFVALAFVKKAHARSVKNGVTEDHCEETGRCMFSSGFQRR